MERLFEVGRGELEPPTSAVDRPQRCATESGRAHEAGRVMVCACMPLIHSTARGMGSRAVYPVKQALASTKDPAGCPPIAISSADTVDS